MDPLMFSGPGSTHIIPWNGAELNGKFVKTGSVVEGDLLADGEEVREA